MQPPGNEDQHTGPESGGVAATVEIDVDFGDCDPAQIVFYPNYFRWFDRGTWRLFAGMGLSRDTLRERYGLAGHPIVKAGGEFFASSRPGDRITVQTGVTRWGGKSFDLRHVIHKSDGRLAAEGFETRVWAVADPDDPARMRGGRIPDEVIALFGGTRDER
jgi:4-hydroxybenzoyl-CoA thioesterase